MRQLIVRPLAESDLDEAARWYDDHQPGLGVSFFYAVDQVFERLQRNPLQFPLVYHDLRRALLHTFPYAVYFRVAEENVQVLAVLHLRRSPSTWRARV